MPGEAAFAWMNRIRAVEQEYRLTRLAVDRLYRHAMQDPNVLAGDLRHRDIDVVLKQLEGTYLVRLFSEFETALRHFLRASKLSQPSKVEVLINKVRDRIGIANVHTDDVHKVRKYRNVLVHDRLEKIDPVTLREATKYCGTFLSWLQRTW